MNVYIKSCFIIYILLFAFISSSFSQRVIVHASLENKKSSAQSDSIYYDFNRQLTWEDFKGKPDLNSPGGAVTASGYAFDSEMDFNGTDIDLSIMVYTFFTKHQSWKKPGINSDYHLLHEQHHFDITRLGAERLVQEISKAHFTKENYKPLLTSIFEKVHKENAAMQQQYDSETAHSIDTVKQGEWNDRIAAAIEKLKKSVVVKN